MTGINFHIPYFTIYQGIHRPNHRLNHCLNHIGNYRINSIFNGIANDNSKSIDEKIEIASNYDFSQFSQLEEFARAKSQSVVTELNNFKNDMDTQEKQRI